MASFGGERRRMGSSRVLERGLARVLGGQRAQTLGDGAPRRRELYEALIQVLHLRQDELGLRPVQFPDIQGDYLAAPVREHGEREYRRFNPQSRGGVEGVLFADEQGVGDFEAVGKL